MTSNHSAVQPAVANMSLGGGANSSVDAAVNNSINDGVTYAIASGNSNADACGFTPARVAAALTVNSSTSSDARSSFSNYGTCTDLFAPGSSITSAWYTSNTATNTISGTSMATPHVAGAAALYLETNPSASPATVANAIKSNATSGKITSPGSAPIYFSEYGWDNFLWLCDLGNFIIGAALVLESRLLLSSQAVGVLVVQIVWTLDATTRLFFGRHLVGGTEYMFDATIPLLLRLFSLFQDSSAGKSAV